MPMVINSDYLLLSLVGVVGHNQVFDLSGSSAAINQSNPLYSIPSLYSIGVAIVSICDRDAKSRFGRDRQI